MSKTSIYRMRRIVDGEHFTRDPEKLIRPDALEEYPFRDVDVLRQRLDECHSVVELVEEWDTTFGCIQRWADAYGIDYEIAGRGELSAELLEGQPDV